MNSNSLAAVFRDLLERAVMRSSSATDTSMPRAARPDKDHHVSRPWVQKLLFYSWRPMSFHYAHLARRPRASETKDIRDQGGNACPPHRDLEPRDVEPRSPVETQCPSLSPLHYPARGCTPAGRPSFPLCVLSISLPWKCRPCQRAQLVTNPPRRHPSTNQPPLRSLTEKEAETGLFCHVPFAFREKRLSGPESTFSVSWLGVAH